MLKATFHILLCLILSSGVVFSQSDKNKRKEAEEHLQHKEFEQAIPIIQELLDTEPNSAYYNFWMGKSLYLTYKKNKALTYLEKAYSINPDVDEELHYYYGLTLHCNLKFDKAITEYQQDLERYKPNSTEYNFVNNRISQCVYAKDLVAKREGAKVRIENMGPKINTPYAEHSPVISANDSVLLFTARRPDSKGANPEQEYYDEDVYVSFKKGNTWTEAKNIDEPVNHKGHDATISLNADADRLYIYRHKKEGGLFVTDLDSTAKTWKEPRALKKPFKSKYYEASICESADGRIKFFTSERPGGFGGRDIYMLKVEDDTKDDWGDPINLGPVINTVYDEDAPYFHPDNKTLYYSSNGPNSMGGFDIFVTEMDTEGIWLPPLNMGYPINTADDDIYFVLSADGVNGYYSSGKEGGYGEKDIYNVVLPYYPYPRRFHVVELQGIVQDIETKDTLLAVVRLVDAETNQVLDSVDTRNDLWQYYFLLEPEREYALEVSSRGYLPYTESLTSPVLEDEDILVVRNLLLAQPMVSSNPPETNPPDEVSNLPEVMNLYFDFDKYNLREQSQQELGLVKAIVAQNEDINIELRGHTDWYGTNDYNVKLSERRSNAAYKFLVANGVDPDRINMSYFSENKPIETNEDDEGRQYNRRTEIHFYKGDRFLFASKKLKTGVESIPVDHTRPKGQPGFDAGDAVTNNFDPGTPDAWSDSGNGTDNNTEGTGTPDRETGPTGMSFRHIYYDFDRFNLRQTSMKELDRIFNYLNDHPDVELEIQGHTDAWGGDGYNQVLSERRSESAYDYLVSRGINADRLQLTGYSERSPIDENNSASGRQNNRRVEFVMIKNGKIIARSSP